MCSAAMTLDAGEKGKTLWKIIVIEMGAENGRLLGLLRISGKMLLRLH